MQLGTSLSPAEKVGPTSFNAVTVDSSGALDGLLYSATIFAAVKEAAPVYETLGRLSQDFGHTVSLLPSGAVSEAAAVGYRHWLQGHIGETIASHALERSSHGVEFAARANQPGWDLMVDGQAVNVKVGTSAYEMVQQHLHEHPGIGVVTDQVTAAKFAGADVVGLPDLDAGHVGDAYDAATNVHEAGSFLGDFHVPVFTLVMSSWREANSACRHGGDFGESVQAVVTKGGGVLVGAKVGGVIGTMVFPGAGSIVGSLVGSIAGSFSVAHVFARQAKAKAEAFQQYLPKFERGWSSKHQVFIQEVDTISRRWQTEYERELQPVEDFLVQRSVELQGALARSFASLAGASVKLFDRMRSGLDEDLRLLDTLAPKRSDLVRFAFPSWRDHYRDLATAWIAGKRREVNDAEADVAKHVAELELTCYGAVAYKVVARKLVELTKRFEISDETLAVEADNWISSARNIAADADRLTREAREQALPLAQRYQSNIDQDVRAAWSLQRSNFVGMLSEAQTEWTPVARAIERAGGKTGDPFVAHRQMISALDGEEFKGTARPEGLVDWVAKAWQDLLGPVSTAPIQA